MKLLISFTAHYSLRYSKPLLAYQNNFKTKVARSWKLPVGADIFIKVKCEKTMRISETNTNKKNPTRLLYQALASVR